jgi:hypothetical protein
MWDFRSASRFHHCVPVPFTIDFYSQLETQLLPRCPQAAIAASREGSSADVDPRFRDSEDLAGDGRLR